MRRPPPLSSAQLLGHHPSPTDQEIRHYLSGNLWRCAAYPDIIAAVKRAAELMDLDAGLATR